MEEWLVENARAAILGGGGEELNVSGIATYQPADGLPELKMVITNSFLFFFLLTVMCF